MLKKILSDEPGLIAKASSSFEKFEGQKILMFFLSIENPGGQNIVYE